MFRICKQQLASLRYRRPYWMLFLRDVDNWRIYTVIQQPDHQRTEMLYQAWLGGLDRPYVRPKCMAHQPLWLTKKRHMMQRARLQGPQTALEKYVLEWYRKFHSFNGNERPTAQDLHTAFDLVQRPLDLSYACQLLNQCRNHFNIRFTAETFVIFLQACLRVDRKDCARYVLANAQTLGFWYVDENCRRYLDDQQSWYRLSLLDNLYYPIDENKQLNRLRTTSQRGYQQKIVAVTDSTDALHTLFTKESVTADNVDTQQNNSSDVSVDINTATEDNNNKNTVADREEPAVRATVYNMSEEDDELARLQAELKALEAEMSADFNDSSQGDSNKDNKNNNNHHSK